MRRRTVMQNLRKLWNVLLTPRSRTTPMSSTSRMLLDELTQEIEEEVRAKLPAYLLQKAVVYHGRKGIHETNQDCQCEFCQTKHKATHELRWCHWRYRVKNRLKYRKL